MESFHPLLAPDYRFLESRIYLNLSDPYWKIYSIDHH